MATVQWIANAAAVAQTRTVTVNSVANGATLTASFNGKAVQYVCTVTDTITTAAQNWQTLLSATGALPEFQELTFTVTSNVITVAANAPGTPFAGVSGNGLSFAALGGASLSVTETVANGSPSDVINPLNWLRGGANALPQAGDAVVLADSSVPLLWNLDLFPAGVASFDRWQSFTATVGLPENNPSGYREWRATYLQLGAASSGSSSSSSPSALALTLGLSAPDGGGPTRERYNVGNAQTIFTALASGGAADDYAVRFLGTNPANTVAVVGTSVGVAMLPAETSALASALVGTGGQLDLGAGVSLPGTLTNSGGSCRLNMAPGSVVAQEGASVVVIAASASFPSVTARNGSSLTWNGGGSIASLALETGATLDKSGDLRPLSVLAGTIDGDTCFVNDPFGVISYPNGLAVKAGAFSAPFTFPAGKKVTVQ